MSETDRPRTSLMMEVAEAPVRATSQWLSRLGPGGALLVALGLVVVDFGLAIHGVISLPLTILQSALAVPWVALVLRREPSERPPSGWMHRLRETLAHLLNIAIVLFALFQKWRLLLEALRAETVEHHVSGYRSFAVVMFFAAAFGVLGRGHRAQKFLAESADHPARLMILSFGITAFVGGFLLSLPEAVVHVRDASFLDGLFTAVSAVCVTGLAVNDVGATYTLFGEAVILLLAQVGGLGIMVLSASFAVLAGRSLKVKQSAVLVEMIDASSLAALRRTLVMILVYTLAFEAIGVLLLYWFVGAYPAVVLGPESPDLAAGAGDRLWWAVFHSVSAFCNAGFSLSHGNLAAFVESWPLGLVVAALIVLGGIGFPVIDEVVQHGLQLLRGTRPPRLSLHARVSLVTSAGLIVVVGLAVLALEWTQSLAHLPWHARVLAAFFQSVSMRTAGFNTIDIGGMRAATIFLTCVVMFIGASPGSTGGGIKTTTFATLFAAFRGELKGQKPRLFDRQLGESTVSRAMAVSFLSVAIVAGFCMVLMITENHDPLRCIFEVVSAFATCGLSTGITAQLSPLGKMVIIGAMFIGRIGPLTLAVAMGSAARKVPVQLAEERVMIG